MQTLAGTTVTVRATGKVLDTLGETLQKSLGVTTMANKIGGAMSPGMLNARTSGIMQIRDGSPIQTGGRNREVPSRCLPDIEQYAFRWKSQVPSHCPDLVNSHAESAYQSAAARHRT